MELRIVSMEDKKLQNLPNGTMVKFVDQFDQKPAVGRTVGPRIMKKGVSGIAYLVEPGFKNGQGNMVFGAQRCRLINSGKLTLVQESENV